MRASFQELKPNLLNRLSDTLLLAKTNIAALYRGDIFNDEIQPHFRLKDKAANETAYLAYMASTIADFPQTPLTDDLKHELVNIAADERLNNLLKRYPVTAGTLGYLPMFLGCLGVKNTRWDGAIRYAFQSGLVEGTERFPFRLMELRYMHSLYTGSKGDYTDLIPLSVLAKNMHPVYMDRADTYALTHALMYVTDHGRQPLPPSIDRNRISLLIDAALAYYMMTENVDILVELLMCAIVLGDGWSPYVRFAWRYIEQVWDELGYLPGPRDESIVPRSFMSDARQHSDFPHIYHTTYMGAILYTLVLNNPRQMEKGWTAPVVEMPSGLLGQCREAIWRGRTILDHSLATEAKLEDSMMDSITARIGQMLGFCNLPDARWKVTLAESPIAEHEAASILLDGLITQACVYYDLNALAGTLYDVMRFDLPITFTVVEGIIFLLRQQYANGVVGAQLLATNPESPFAQRITHAAVESLVAVTTRLA